MHALKYYSSPKGEQYDTSTLLDVLSFTKGGEKVIEQKEKEEEDRKAAERASMFGSETAPLSSPESQPEFYSFRKGKKGDTRIAEYNEEKEGYNPGAAALNLKIPSLEKLAGRALKPSEQNKFRKLLNDPTLLRYFMDMMGEKDLNFRKVKILKNLSTGKGSAGSSKKGGKGCVGEGCDNILSGKALSWGDY